MRRRSASFCAAGEGRGEQGPARLGQRAGGGADLEHVLELDPVEPIHDHVRSEQRRDAVARRGGRARAPGGLEPRDLLLHEGAVDPAPVGERAEPGDDRHEVAEVPRPRRATGEREEGRSRLAVEAHPPPGAGGELLELVVEVRLEVLRALGEPRQPEGPQVDPGEQVLAEAPVPRVDGEVPVRARHQPEVGGDLAVAAERQEPLVLEGPQQHRLLVEAELPDLVEEQDPAVGGGEQAAALADRAGERAAGVPEQRRHGAVAPDGGAVHLDERARHHPPLALQGVDPAGELGLPGPGRAGEEHRRLGGEDHPLQAVDHLVERRVPGVDAALEEPHRLLATGGEPPGDAVVAREIEVDDLQPRLAVRPGRRGLHELAGDEARLHQQEQADLGDVGAGRDVDPVLALVRAQRGALDPLEEGGVDPLEVPRVVEVELVQRDGGGRRDRAHVGGDHLGERAPGPPVQQLDPVDLHVVPLHEGDGRPPPLPAAGAAPVEGGPEQADDGDRQAHATSRRHLILSYRS